MKIAVIPFFNEERTIGKVVSETRRYVDKVLAVDDGSYDHGYLQAERAGAIVLRQPINMGKGFTLQTGCDRALSLGADVIVLIDGDGQHDPADIPRLVGLLKKGGLDLVFGSRSLDRNMPATKKIGNWLISKSAKALFGVDVKDTQSGFKVISAGAYEKLRWESRNYAVESEIIMMAGRTHLKYGEAVIKTIYTDKFRGTTIIDGLKIILNMLWWRVSK